MGRYGGEEFLVILPGSNAAQACQLLNTIRMDFAQIRHPVPDTTFACTFSGGVAQWAPSVSAEDLIKQADEALYQAKRAGRNRVL